MLAFVTARIAWDESALLSQAPCHETLLILKLIRRLLQALPGEVWQGCCTDCRAMRQATAAAAAAAAAAGETVLVSALM